MKNTIFSIALKVCTWYIDHTTEEGVSKPYSVFCDDKFHGSLATLGAAFEVVAKKIGYCQLEKVQSIRT